MGKTNHGFADVLRFLYGTGCRPSEAFKVEARYYHRGDRCVIYPGHPGPDDFAWKNARRTGKDRVIFLPDDIARTVEARIKEHPAGPIFLTNRGTPWASVNVSVNIRWYAKQLDVSPFPAVRLRVPAHLRDRLAPQRRVRSKVLAHQVYASLFSGI